MQQPSESGRISALYVDPKYNWFVTGTTDGILTLWDLRYQIIVRRWSGHGRVLLIQGHPGNGSGNWIVVSYGSPDSGSTKSRSSAGPILFVYDVATTHLTQVLAVSSGEDASISALRQVTSNVQPTVDLEDKSSARKIQSIAKDKDGADVEQNLDPFTQEEAADDDHPHQDILAVHRIRGSRVTGSLESGLRTVHEATGSSQGKSLDDLASPTIRQAALLVTAGEDRIVRLWNMSNISASMVVSGSGKDAEKVYRRVLLFFARGPS